MLAERAQRVLETDARAALAAALTPLPGPKALLVDASLYTNRLATASPLDLFTDATYLREHGIRTVASLTPPPRHLLPALPELPSIAILIRGPNAHAARAAVTAIRLLTPPPPAAAPAFLVLTTPRRSPLVEKILHGTGLAHVAVAPLPLGFLPFDADLVTLDWPAAYRRVVLDADNSALLAAAAALAALAARLHLDFATIRSAGPAAAAVAEELLHTHGQSYPRPLRPAHAPDSPPMSLASSPALRARPAPLLAAHQALSSLHPSPASTTSQPNHQHYAGPSPGPDHTMDSVDDASTPTLAHVVGNDAKRRPVNLVIIDRGVDMVSPMLTQWTYEGLLEESVWLHNNVMDLPVASIVSEDAMGILAAAPNAAATAGTLRKRLRGDVDPIFAELRDQNYWTAARQLGSRASQVRAYYDARPTRETAEISQVKEYVKGLKDVKTEHWSAAAHTAIAAEISARTFDSYEFKRRFELEREMMEGSTATGRLVYITDAIARGESLCHVLRLCCLWSLTSSGIDSDEFEKVRREILAIFGLATLPLLANLERAGMLVRSYREVPTTTMPWLPFPNFGGVGSDIGSTSGSLMSSAVGSDEGRRYRSARAAAEYSWQFARAALRLVTEFDPDKQVTPGTAAAIAAPYSGYTPLSVRLVEAGLSEEGWGSLPHIVTHTSLLPPGHVTVEHRKGEVLRSLQNGGLDGEGFDAVILFVGGITRAEASAVRLAAKSAGVRALIATTAVLGPDAFIRSLTDEMGREGL